MKRILLCTIFIISLTFTNVFATPMKFDLGSRIYLGKYFGLVNSKATDANINKSLSAAPFGAALNLDLIFLTEDKKSYGMGLGLYLGFTIIDQFLGTMYMTNGQTNSFTSTDNTNLTQALSISQFEIGFLYRFYPTRDFSIGVGPVINAVLGKGNVSFLQSDFYANETSGNSNYYIQPMFGSIYLSILADAQVTKFFGNLGVNFGIDLRLLFKPFTVGIGGTAGIKYRFDP